MPSAKRTTKSEPSPPATGIRKSSRARRVPNYYRAGVNGDLAGLVNDAAASSGMSFEPAALGALENGKCDVCVLVYVQMYVCYCC